MSTWFSASNYGNAALYFVPNGNLNNPAGPYATRWLLGNDVNALLWNSNLGFPRTSPYTHFTSPVKFPPSGPSACAVFPARVAARYALLPNTANYATGT